MTKKHKKAAKTSKTSDSEILFLDTTQCYQSYENSKGQLTLEAHASESSESIGESSSDSSSDSSDSSISNYGRICESATGKEEKVIENQEPEDPKFWNCRIVNSDHCITEDDQIIIAMSNVQLRI